jgi:hypothetical protein
MNDNSELFTDGFLNWPYDSLRENDMACKHQIGLMLRCRCGFHYKPMEMSA